MANITTAQPVFECNSKMLLTQYNSGPPTTINEVLVSGGVVNFTPFVSHTVVHNAAGYNRLDNYIYSIRPSTRTVFRLHSDGTFLNMGSIPSLPLGLVAGDVDSNGIYVASASNGNLYFIDVSGTTAQLLQTIPLQYNSTQYTGTPRFIDFAFHPTTQRLWGMDNNLQRMVQIDVSTGTVFPIGPQQTGIALGAMFFNTAGDLYGYDANSLYFINQTTGAINFVAYGPVGAGRDGCSCPYTLFATRKVTPQSACVGDTVTYEVNIYNRTGSSMQGVSFTDTLPAGLTIVQAVAPFQGTTQAGTGAGSSIWKITGMQLAKGENIFQYKVVIDSALAGQTVSDQAMIHNLSVVTYDSLFTDDPNIFGPLDSTALTVYPFTASDDLIVTNGAQCVGDTLVMQSLKGSPIASYTWIKDDSIRSTNKTFQIPNLHPSDAGTYILEMLDFNCTLVYDTIQVQITNCGNTFDCQNPFFLGYSNTGTQLGRLHYNPLFLLQDNISFTDSINALGYNAKDNLIYGVNTRNNMVRLYSDGDAADLMDLDLIFPGNAPWIAGDIDTSGRYTIINANGFMAHFNTNAKIPQRITDTILRYEGGGNALPFFGDIAYHPISQQLYGFDTVTQRFARIDPVSGVVDTFGKIDTGIHIEALMINNFGRIYGYGQDTLFRILPDSGRIVEATTAQPDGILDGCHCPTGLAVEKVITPRYNCRHDTFTIYLNIRNNTGQPQPTLRIAEYLPPDLIITGINDTLGGFLAGSPIGTGRYLRLNATIAPGLSQIAIEATHRASFTGGAYFMNQAFVITNNGYLGDTIFSDDPGSLFIVDSTRMQIGPVDTTIASRQQCGTDSLYLHGQWITHSGRYQFPLTNRWLCDSLLIVDVQLYPAYNDTATVQICQGGQYYAGGQWQTTSGWYTDSLVTQHGCDSIITTHLQVLPFVTTQLTSSICPGDSVLAGGQWQKTPGTYYDTLISYLGCDSIVIHTVQVLVPTSSQIYRTLCQGDSLLFNGQYLFTAGTYHDTLVNGAGCDSIISLTIQLSNTLYGQSIHSICAGDSIRLAQRWIAKAVRFSDTLVSTQGCDSIHTYEVSVNPITTDSLTLYRCQGDSAFLGGNWQTQPGWYVDTFVSSQGCDSLLYTQLIINNHLTTHITASICQGQFYPFNGRSLSASGQYIDTLISQSGCDSLVHLTLTVHLNPTPDLGDDTTLCEGESLTLDPGSYTAYTWNTGAATRTLTVGQSGLYQVTVTDSNGCQASDARNIAITPKPTFTLGKDSTYCPGFTFTYVFNIANVRYRWSNGDTVNQLTINQPGTYWLQVSRDACTVTDTVQVNEYPRYTLTMPPDTLICLSETFLVDIQQPHFVKYQWSHGPATARVVITEPGTYNVQATDENGCISNGSVVLEKAFCPPAIHWPSAFSPNSDGRNDIFEISSHKVDILEVRIFNRWGAMVFQTHGNHPWDGTFNGTPAPMGTYIIWVSYQDERGQVHRRKANLTLLR